MPEERFGEGPVGQPPQVPDTVYTRITTAEYHATWLLMRDYRRWIFQASNALEKLALAMPLETRDERNAGPGYYYWQIAKNGQKLLEREV